MTSKEKLLHNFPCSGLSKYIWPMSHPPTDHKISQPVHWWPALRLLLYVLLATVLVLGRDHYVLGTGLILLRWVLPLLALIWCWRQRKRSKSLLLKTGCLVLLLMSPVEWLYGYSQHERLSKPEGQYGLSLLSFNLYFKNSNPKETIRMIRQESPDMILLQEFTHIWQAALHPALLAEYPHFKLFPRRGAYGLAFYSRYPIDDYELLSLPKSPFYAQRLDLRIDGRMVGVINGHFASPAIAVEHPDDFLHYYADNFALRQQQIDSIGVWSREQDYTLQVLGGDLNTSKLDPLYRHLRRDWVDMNDGLFELGSPTFPQGHDARPLLTLDYLLLKGQATRQEVKTIAVPGSDHYALLGRLVF